MKVTCVIYVKTRIDMSAKYGAYAIIYVTAAETFSVKARFKAQVPTPTAADCKAAINALSRLIHAPIFEKLTDVVLVTDSGKVDALITTFKAEKHCEEAAKRWREEIKPHYEGKNLTIRKAKAEAGTTDGYGLMRCEDAANNELKSFKQLLT